MKPLTEQSPTPHISRRAFARALAALGVGLSGLGAVPRAAETRGGTLSGAHSGAQQPSQTQTGQIQTVLGPIDPDELGITLTHEHLLIDFNPNSPPPDPDAEEFSRRPVTAENVAFIRYHYRSNTDNFQLLDVDTAIAEAMLYRNLGGQSMVDATNRTLQRDPEGLVRIARGTGLNIIMGSLYYTGGSTKSEDEIVEESVREVTEGANGTGIKPGVLGEVGCSWPLRPNERKVLRAAARAQQRTGAPMLVHPGRDEAAPMEILGILRDAGANFDHLIMGHLDRTVFTRSILKEIAETGCFLEWDLFGQEQSRYRFNPDVEMPSDAKRMDDIAWISAEGYGRKVVIAQDICFKHLLVKFGGPGYSYILSQIVPRMRTRGFSEAAVNDILVENPKDALTFFAPREA